MKNLPTKQLKALAKQANAAHAHFFEGVRNSATYAWECGNALCQAKELANHGEWLPWLEKNCPDISASTALRWMKLSKSVTLTNFTWCPSAR